MSHDSRNPGSFRLLLAEQVRTNSRLFFKLAFNVLREATAAEDVCQHAFMKAWECRHEITDEQALRAWLAKVIVNESLRLARRKKVETRAMTDQRLIPAHAAMPEHQRAEVQESVVAAVAALPDPVRTVVSLRMQSGLSGNEVKEILGVSAAEVSRQLHSGLDMLREKLAPFNSAEMGVRNAV